MDAFADRLMLRGSKSRGALPAAIFGSAGGMARSIELDKPPVRIGLWPLQSETDPELAMGLLVVLALLLDRYRDVRIYRLMAQVEGSSDDYKWNIARSQFDVDDWQLDELDENAAVWGTLNTAEDRWQLVLEVENDTLDDNAPKVFEYNAETLADLINLLPSAAGDVARYLNAADTELLAIGYPPLQAENDVLKHLLQRAFHWERKLYLSLWGVDWQEQAFTDDSRALQDAGLKAGDFGAWLVSGLITRVMLFTDHQRDELFIPLIEDFSTAYIHSPLPGAVLGKALFDAQQIERAYDLLESSVEQHENDPALRLAMAELYRRGGRILEAVQTFQDAIEDQVVSAQLYTRYADLLTVLDFNNISLNELVLVRGSQSAASPLLWEAVAAYRAALTIEPNNLSALSAQLVQLVELGADDERLWDDFEQLVSLDKTGDAVRSVVDAFANYDDDISPAIEVLEEAVTREADRTDLHLSLAIAYLADEDGDAAVQELQKVQNLTSSPEILADIQRLMLIAEDPEFEFRLGEINDIISAGNKIGADDVGFLEEALEKAPEFDELYLLIARAYLGWEENSSAIETLLDGHEHLPENPEILALLSRLLWESGEHELAFNYLNKGIAANPNYVPLLARMGQYLFEDDQEEASKAYLTRAEMISPRDPVLARVRVHIARMLGQ